MDIFKDANINLNICKYKETARGSCPIRIKWEVCRKKKDFSCTIYTITDPEKVRKIEPKAYNSVIERSSDFLNSLDIEITDEVFILETMLHEFGHAHQILKFMEITKPIKFIHYSDNINSCVNLVFGSKIYSNDVYSNFRPEEVYAEMFKFKYFYKFYKMIFN